MMKKTESTTTDFLVRDIDSALHRLFKTMCAEKGVPMGERIKDLMANDLKVYYKDRASKAQRGV